MLTKFLLNNNFPLNSFYTMHGTPQSYAMKEREIIVYFYQSIAGVENASMNYNEIEVVEINPYLFNTYFQIYKDIIKELKDKNLQEYIEEYNKKRPTKFSDRLKKKVITNITSNDFFRMEMTGKVIDCPSSMHNSIQIGEEVYIDQMTSTTYHIRTVDNIKNKVKKSAISLKTIKNPAEYVADWKKALKTLKEEYDQFMKP